MSVSSRCSAAVNNVLTVIVQNSHNSTVLGALDLNKIDYQSNLGDLLDVFLKLAGLAYSADGKQLWRVADESITLTWRETAANNSRRPRQARGDTIGGLAYDGLAHDPNPDVAAGGVRARAAATAARPPPPRALELSAPVPQHLLLHGSRVVGTGHGHVARATTACCIAETGSLDELVLLVQNHCGRCGPTLRRVDGGGKAYWSSHSVVM